MKNRISAAILTVVLVSCAGISEGGQFQELRRGHFVIHHMNRQYANSVSWKAEYHYKRIVNHIGVKGFRPWEGEEKCAIYLYPSQAAYVAGTGAPVWSAGQAHVNVSQIDSFEGAKDFEDGTLPHEITHVLLNKFFEGKEIPLWLNEGMAQFEEETDKSTYWNKRYMKERVRAGSFFPLSALFSMKGVPQDVSLYYAQSASVVDHLISSNIRTNFGKFLEYMKKGLDTETALQQAFQWKYKHGIGHLDKRWQDYVKKRY